MNISKINNNSYFCGITKYNRKIVKEIPNYTRITFEYNYYPFIDESPEEFEAKVKDFKCNRGRFWDGYNPRTGESCGGMEEYTLVKQPCLNITESEFISQRLSGLSEYDILDNALKHNK